jgi:hypothetical protein
MKGKHLQNKIQCPLCPAKYVEFNRIKAHILSNHMGEISADFCASAEKKQVDCHKKVADRIEGEIPAGICHSGEDCKGKSFNCNH